MQTPIDRLPEVASISGNRINSAICAAAALRSMLVRARSRDDLDAALALISVIGRAPTILVAFHGTESSFYINHGWPAEWVERYCERGYSQVDPVIRAASGVPIVWSELLQAPVSSNAARKFIEDCKRAGMMHGLTYISDRGEGVRYVLSMIGRNVEEDRCLRDLLEMLLPDLAEVACRVFASIAKLANLTPVQRKLIDLYCHGGVRKRADLASALGISIRGVDYNLERLMDHFGAVSTEQMIYRIATCD